MISVVDSTAIFSLENFTENGPVIEKYGRHRPYWFLWVLYKNLPCGTGAYLFLPYPQICVPGKRTISKGKAKCLPFPSFWQGFSNHHFSRGYVSVRGSAWKIIPVTTPPKTNTAPEK